MKKIVVATTIALAAAFLVTFSVTYIDSLRSDVWGLDMALLISSVASVVALIVMLVWAIPIHLLLNKYKLTSVKWYVLAGVFPALIFIYVFKPFGNDSAIDLLKQFLFCSLIGAISAFCFWYFVTRPSLTKSSKATPKSGAL